VADAARIDDLRRRLDREPGSRVFAQLAEELRKAGQLPEAVRVARQGLLVHPGYPSARMTLGRALMDMRDLRGARAEFEAVLRGAADNILASRFLGECLEGLGDLGSALLQYRATLRLAPGDRNLETQIRALEQKLTPTPAGPTAPPPHAPRVPALPREGAIPVLDVDGPMELEGSFDRTVAWQPTAAPRLPDSATPGPAPAAEPALAPEPPTPAVNALEHLADDVSPPVSLQEPEPDQPLVPEGVAASTLAAGPTEAQESEPSAAGGSASFNESFPEQAWPPPEPQAPAVAVESPPTPDAPPLSSSTLAELYFNQGFTRQAIDVYRELSEREPGSERIAARILELEAIERQLESGPIAPPLPSPDPKERRREALQRTITRLEGFLAAVRRA
jgi:tetratricopeptide (TPR) repeat protein